MPRRLETKLRPRRTHGRSFLLDLDGTLLDIAGRPEDVIIPMEFAANLNRVCGGLSGALEIIRDRSLVDIDRFLHPLRKLAIDLQRPAGAKRAR